WNHVRPAGLAGFLQALGRDGCPRGRALEDQLQARVHGKARLEDALGAIPAIGLARLADELRAHAGANAIPAIADVHGDGDLAALVGVPLVGVQPDLPLLLRALGHLELDGVNIERLLAGIGELQRAGGLAADQHYPGDLSGHAGEGWSVIVADAAGIEI